MASGQYPQGSHDETWGMNQGLDAVDPDENFQRFVMGSRQLQEMNVSIDQYFKDSRPVVEGSVLPVEAPPDSSPSTEFRLPTGGIR